MQEYVISDSAHAETDSLLAARILPYRDTLQRTMARVLAVSAQPLEKKLPEGPLGNFVADACLAEANLIAREPADLAIFNHGGLRRSLPEGNVTLGDVFELMPFDNELVILDLPGPLLREVLDFVATNGGAPVSGVRLVIRAGRAESVFVGKEPLDTNRHYRVLTSDYLANGGDRFSQYARATGREELRVKVRDAIVQHLERLGMSRRPLVVATDGRIQTAGE